MKNALLLFVLFALSLAPAGAATEIGRGYKCTAGLQPERMVSTWISRRVIAKDPYYNEDSVTFWEAKPGHTAFGLPLVAIVGYQHDSKMFGGLPGTAPGDHFAFVVKGDEATLRQAAARFDVTISDAGAQRPAVVVGSFRTNEMNLPRGNDRRANYVTVTCEIRN